MFDYGGLACPQGALLASLNPPAMSLAASLDPSRRPWLRPSIPDSVPVAEHFHKGEALTKAFFGTHFEKSFLTGSGELAEAAARAANVARRRGG